MKDLSEASGDVGLWGWAFIPAGVACLLGAAIMLRLRPRKKSSQPMPTAPALAER